MRIFPSLDIPNMSLFSPMSCSNRFTHSSVIISPGHTKGIQKLSAVFDDSCKMSLKFEANFSPLAIGLKILYAFATCIVLLAATKVYMAGDISLVYYIGILLFIIDLFIPLRTFFEQILRLTVMESCLDRMEEIFEESELTDEALYTLNNTFTLE